MPFLGFSLHSKKNSPEWPLDADGERVPAARLAHSQVEAFESDITRNMLEAYGIPTLTRDTGGGFIGEMIMGVPSYGVDIFVPSTMLDDAQALLSAEAQTSQELDESNEEQ
jgi:hypothetical protein